MHIICAYTYILCINVESYRNILKYKEICFFSCFMILASRIWLHFTRGRHLGPHPQREVPLPKCRGARGARWWLFGQIPQICEPPAT